MSTWPPPPNVSQATCCLTSSTKRSPNLVSFYRAVADGLAATGQFDLVCFGHSHEAFIEKSGKSDVLNPGEVMGKDGSPGFYLVDTSARKYELVSLV